LERLASALAAAGVRVQRLDFAERARDAQVSANRNANIVGSTVAARCIDATLTTDPLCLAIDQGTHASRAVTSRLPALVSGASNASASDRRSWRSAAFRWASAAR